MGGQGDNVDDFFSPLPLGERRRDSCRCDGQAAPCPDLGLARLLCQRLCRGQLAAPHSRGEGTASAERFLARHRTFAMAAGSVLVLPLAGWTAGRFGSDATTRGAGLALCLTLPLPILAPNLGALMLAWLLFGTANGMLDVAMNAQAVL